MQIESRNEAVLYSSLIKVRNSVLSFIRSDK